MQIAMKGWAGFGARLVACIVSFGGFAACGAIVSAEGEIQDARTPPSIQITADGGIAALHIVVRVDSSTGDASYQMGPICDVNTTCQVRDSTSIRLERKVVDAFYVRAASQEFRALKADYGTTPNGADMRMYTVTIYANDRARTLRADDGSMPTVMAQFVNDVMAAVRK